MSGRQAKAQRRVDRLREVLVQAHDRLHKDDVTGCHDLLHQGLGAGQVVESDTDELLAYGKWDEAFRRLARRAHRARVAYVLVDDDGRVITGGDADVCGVVDRSLRSTLQLIPDRERPR